MHHPIGSLWVGNLGAYWVFPKMVVPPFHTPKWSFLVGKPIVYYMIDIRYLYCNIYIYMIIYVLLLKVYMYLYSTYVIITKFLSLIGLSSLPWRWKLPLNLQVCCFFVCFRGEKPPKKTKLNVGWWILADEGGDRRAIGGESCVERRVSSSLWLFKQIKDQTFKSIKFQRCYFCLKKKAN